MRNWTWRRFSAVWRDATSPPVAACAAMTGYMSIATPPKFCNGFLRTRAADFHETGVTLPSAVITEGVWRDESSGLKTATKPNDFRGKVSGFPDHFDDTSCVFRADDGRCTLQTLGAKTGRHPWFYKPLVCWLHPINVSPERITIYDENTDPYRYPDYDGFASRTFCGRTAALGRPAYEVLRAELELLGHILGRDLTSQFPAAGTESA